MKYGPCRRMTITSGRQLTLPAKLLRELGWQRNLVVALEVQQLILKKGERRPIIVLRKSETEEVFRS